MKFRKLPVEIEASRWRKIGDHPAVEPFKQPEYDLKQSCVECGQPLGDHGWIDTSDGLDDGEGHRVCPGDWVIADFCPGFWTPTDDKAFRATYEPVDGDWPE